MNQTPSEKISCPKCNSAVRVLASMAGKTVRCPRCKQTFKIPGSVTATTAKSDDDWLNLDDDFSVPTAPPKTDPPRQQANFSDADMQALQNILSAHGGGQDKDFDSSLDDPLAPAAVAAEDGEFRVRCPTCDSISYARPHQVGQKITCPDCLAEVTVREPPKKKAAYKPDLDQAATFGMLDTGPPPARFDTPGAKNIQQLLREAEDAEVEEEPDDYSNPDVGKWLAEIFTIFLDPSVIVHLVFFGVLGSGLALLWMYVPFLVIPITTINAFYWAFAYACGFSIMEAVSCGNRRVEQWPYSDPSEWFGQLFTVVAAALLSMVMPLFLMSAVLGFELAGIFLTMFCLFLFFPFVLFSMLESGTVMLPFSAEVTKSVTRCKEEWGLLYFSSGLLFASLFFLYVFLFVMPENLALFKAVISSFATITAVFAYFSMLGRLAYGIGQTLRLDAQSSPTDEA